MIGAYKRKYRKLKFSVQSILNVLHVRGLRRSHFGLPKAFYFLPNAVGERIHFVCVFAHLNIDKLPPIQIDSDESICVVKFSNGQLNLLSGWLINLELKVPIWVCHRGRKRNGVIHAYVLKSLTRGFINDITR